MQKLCGSSFEKFSSKSVAFGVVKGFAMDGLANTSYSYKKKSIEEIQEVKSRVDEIERL